MVSVLLNLLRFILWPQVSLKYSAFFWKKKKNLIFFSLSYISSSSLPNYYLIGRNLLLFFFLKLVNYSGTSSNHEWLLFYGCGMPWGYLLFLSSCSHRFLSCSPIFVLFIGLRSGKLGEQCEAVVRFPRLFQKYPFPILINSAFLKLADVFRVG